MSDTKKTKAPREPEHDPELVARLAERVYRSQLGEKSAASMVEKDGDGGVKLRRRSVCYATIVKATLDALKLEEV